MFDINTIEERCVLEVGKYYNLIEVRKGYMSKKNGEDVPTCVIEKKVEDIGIDKESNTISIEVRADAIAEHILNNKKSKENLVLSKNALDKLIEDIDDSLKKNRELNKKIESIIDNYEAKFTRHKYPFYVTEMDVYDKKDEDNSFTVSTDEDCRKNSRYAVAYSLNNAFPYLEDIADCFTDAHELRIELIEDENEIVNAEKAIEKKHREREEHWSSKPDEPSELYWGDII